MPTASYIHGNYIDEVLSMRRVDGSGVIRDFYYHQDDLFNVTMVTDASGAAVERYEYGDYGAPRLFDGGGAALGSSALSATRLFNGREWDAEVAMYYYRTRYLEPTLGRFTTRDSIGVWGDEGNVGNGVGYGGNRPYSRLDPFGLEPFDPLTSPTVPLPLDFRPGKGSDGKPLNFTDEDKDNLNRGMRGACAKAQCALRGLTDSETKDGVRGSCKSAAIGISDPELLIKRLKRFLNRFCNGDTGGKPLPVAPYVDPGNDQGNNDPLTYPYDDTRPVSYPVLPKHNNRIPPRDIPTDFIHEPFHRIHDTYDEDGGGWFSNPKPNNNQHRIDSAISSACNAAKSKGIYPKDQETQYRPADLRRP